MLLVNPPALRWPMPGHHGPPHSRDSAIITTTDARMSMADQGITELGREKRVIRTVIERRTA